ncbi:MAG TPA: serine/threonine-protein kinase, partial [Polyangiaceae bacterium]|nr:serine/threonine-protein kinase [Polyangiaceae bacterium]
MSLAPGAVVAARYRATRLLGQGGMGEVWAAVHSITGRQVALKVLKAEKAARPESVQRFFREARAATAVGHENVVEVHDVFSFEGAPVMVMELLEGESLGDKLRREGRLSLPELATLMVPVVSAVGTAHARGIVHRDLKPENIFLARGTHGAITPKVLDFGIAKLMLDDGGGDEAAALTRTGSMVGTPFYMAPEQASGERDFDHRCDVWSLGVICFEALLGKRPFGGDNFGQIFKQIIVLEPGSLSQLAPELPREVAELVDGMLVKERAGRRGLGDALRVLAPYAAVTAADFGSPLARGSALPAEWAASPREVPLAEAEQATLEEASAPASDVEPLLGTLEATTLGEPRSARSSKLTPLAFGAVALGVLALGGFLKWSTPRPVARLAAATSFSSNVVSL